MPESANSNDGNDDHGNNDGKSCDDHGNNGDMGCTLIYVPESAPQQHLARTATGVIAMLVMEMVPVALLTMVMPRFPGVKLKLKIKEVK